MNSGPGNPYLDSEIWDRASSRTFSGPTLSGPALSSD
jgi:hypothetical protein